MLEAIILAAVVIIVTITTDAGAGAANTETYTTITLPFLLRLIRITTQYTPTILILYYTMPILS